jgi:hypothetical protein
MMADLAQVWHWQPSEMEQMSFAELSMWHNEAVLRNPKDKD